MKILTFDIEDWFHILDNPETSYEDQWRNMPSRIDRGINLILDLLEKTDQPATFFCLGWVAEKYPHLIKAISDRGHHIGSHSHMHQLAYTQNKKDFKDDLVKSIDILQQISGQKIDTYRAPGFSITSSNLWAFDILHASGIVNDCSIFPASRAHGGIPEYSEASPSIIKINKGEMRSFPINTSKMFGRNIVYSGGGYFRLLPKGYLRRRFAQDKYVMTYFHPRDFDPNQPLVPGLNYLRRFKSYVGIKGAYKKLDFLLSTYRFLDIKQAIGEINWRMVKRVKLNT